MTAVTLRDEREQPALRVSPRVEADGACQHPVQRERERGRRDDAEHRERSGLCGGLGDEARPACAASGEQRCLRRAPAGDKTCSQDDGGRCQGAAQQSHREHARAGDPALLAGGVDRACERQVHDDVLRAVAQRAAERPDQRVDSSAGTSQLGGAGAGEVGLHAQGDSAKWDLARGERTGCERNGP